jgi:predicted nucleic acid-binding protein
VKRTYVDAGVLIAAARGKGKLAVKALDVIADTASREFVCSDYIKLEVVPKPTYLGRTAEVNFYEDFFSTVSTWLPFNVDHLKQALNDACVAGLSAIDAIHVVVAANSGCEEIVTSEKPTAAILVHVMSIDE